MKPYVKRGKTDAADAEAIFEAVTRPNMRFVPIKTEEQQSVLMMHRVRDFLVQQLTQVSNALRAHLGECRVAFKSDTRRVERQFLPLNVIFGWLWGEAFPFSSGNLIDRSKQTGFLLKRTKQSNPCMSVDANAEHRRFAQWM